MQLNLYLRSRPSVRSSETLPRSDASNDDDWCLNFAESLVLEELASLETSSPARRLSQQQQQRRRVGASALDARVHMLHIYRGCPQREGLTLAATRRSADILKCGTFKKKIFFFPRTFFPLQSSSDVCFTPHAFAEVCSPGCLLFVVVVFSPPVAWSAFAQSAPAFSSELAKPTQPATIFHPPQSRFVTFFFPPPAPVLSQ